MPRLPARAGPFGLAGVCINVDAAGIERLEFEAGEEGAPVAQVGSVRRTRAGAVASQEGDGKFIGRLDGRGCGERRGRCRLWGIQPGLIGPGAIPHRPMGRAECKSFVARIHRALIAAVTGKGEKVSRRTPPV